MSKNLTKGNHPRKLPKSDFNELVPISLGGTNGTSIIEANDNLNLIAIEHIAVEGGVVPLRNDNFIDEEYFDIPAGGMVTIEGIKNIGTLQTVLFKINNFSNFINYVISVSLGTISRNNDIITYIAPSTPGAEVLVINNINKLLTIYQSFIRIPTITFPVNNSIDISPNIVVTSNSFQANGYSDTHERSLWELATDVNFTNIVQQNNSTSNLVSWEINNLTENTIYYIRVKHKGTVLGFTDWSSVISFTTLVEFIPINEKQKLIPSAGETSPIPTISYYLGTAIAISKDNKYLVISNIPDTSGIIAFIYKKVNNLWVETSYLEHITGGVSTIQATYRTGVNLDINQDGSIIVVGNYGDGDAPTHALDNGFTVWYEEFCGKVYIFHKHPTNDTWIFHQQLTSPTPHIYDTFGACVKLSSDGTKLVVGSCSQSYSAIDNILYNYYKDSNGNWILESILPYYTGSADFDNTNYISVDISDDNSRMVVGYPYKPDIETSPDKEYMFGKLDVYTSLNNGWVLEQTIDGRFNSNYFFGSTVKITNNGDKVFVLAADAVFIPEFGNFLNNFNTDSVFNGIVYVYQRSVTTWNLSNTINVNRPLDVIGFNRGNRKRGWWTSPYGLDINQDGTLIAVGTSGRSLFNISQLTPNYGSFSLFNYDGTTFDEYGFLQPYDLSVNLYSTPRNFGYSVCLNNSGTECYISDLVDNRNNSLNSIGSVYYFGIGNGGIINIEGPGSLYNNETAVFNINNYSSSVSYIMSAQLGSVSRIDDIITYTAPSSGDEDIIIINGIGKTITLNIATVTKPIITSPTTGTIDVGSSVSVTSNAFSYNGPTDTHERTTWELSLFSDFSTIEFTSDINTDLTSILLSNLTPGSNYYLRVKYKGSNIGYSDWSNSITFATESVLLLPLNESHKLVPPYTYNPPNTRQAVSISVSSDKSTLVVGTVGPHDYGNYANGSPNNVVDVYINNNGTYVFTQRLVTSYVEDMFDMLFGQISFVMCSDISANGDVIVVGNASVAWGIGSTGIGHVHVFTRIGSTNTWSETSVLSSSVPFTADLFGQSVKINNAGNKITVSMSNENFTNSSPGSKNPAVYMFDKNVSNGWDLVNVVRPTPLGVTRPDLPSIYCIVDRSETNDVLAISYVEYNSSNFSTFGRVLVYRLISSTWTLEASYVGNNGNKRLFGSCIKLNNTGDRLFIHYFNYSGDTVSSVDIYTRSGSVWTLEQTVVAQVFDNTDESTFGVVATDIRDCIAISAAGTLLAVGNPNQIVNAKPRGSFTLFHKDVSSWVNDGSMTPTSILNVNDLISYEFGRSIELADDGSFCYVGMAGDLPSPSSPRPAGSIFIYSA